MSPRDPVTAVQSLFVEHGAQIRGFVAALMPDPALVDDVVQETFLAISAKAAEYDSARSFLAWAYGFARRKVLENSRRARRGGQPLPDEVLSVLAVMDEAEAELSLAASRLRFVDACIDELTPQVRRIVEYCYRKSLKPAEAARLMGWTPGSVHVALSRARAAIRRCLERKLAAEPGWDTPPAALPNPAR